MTLQLEAMCRDIAHLALKNIKGCGAMEKQEFAESLEAWIEERQAIYAGAPEDES